MNLLRARVHRPVDDGDTWQLWLLDLDIFAEGKSEVAMLQDLEFTLVAEYHLSLKHGQTPFVRRFNEDCPQEVRKAWESGEKKLRSLSLPKEVSQALAAVFKRPTLNEFKVEVAAEAA